MFKDQLKAFWDSSKESLYNSLFLTILLFIVSISTINDTNKYEETKKFIDQLIMNSWIYKFIWIWFISCFILILIGKYYKDNKDNKDNKDKLFVRCCVSINKYFETLLLGATLSGFSANLFVFAYLNFIVLKDPLSRPTLGFLNFCVTSTNLIQIFLIALSILLSKYSISLKTLCEKIIFLAISVLIYLLHFCFFGLCK